MNSIHPIVFALVTLALFIALFIAVGIGGDARSRARCAEELAAQARKECDTAEALIAHLRAEVSRLSALNAQVAAPLQRPALEGLDIDALRAAFDVDDDHALWQAVHQLLDGAIVKAVEGVEPAPSSVFTAEGRTHAAGELSSLREFQRDLLRWQREARRAKQTAGAAEE